MAYKLFVIFINIIIILVLSTTFTYSAPHDIIEHDISKEHDILKEQDDTFICPNNSSIVCCPLLAHRIASDYHSRCASIILINKSGYNLTLDIVNLEDGRWVTPYDYDGNIDINCEPHSILNNGSEVMSSVTSHFLGGILGYVSFSMDDDISSKIVVSWDVPTVGSPGYMVSFTGELSKQKYNVVSQKSFGNTIYQVTIYEKIPWKWPSISPLYIISFLIIAGGCCGCCCFIPFINFMSEELQHNSHRRRERQSYAPLRPGQQRPGRQYYNSTGRDKRSYYNNNNIF